MAAVVKLHESPARRPAQALHGACLCGEVSYEIDGEISSVSHCHCSMCRKHHGTPFATTVAVPVTSFRWLSGAEIAVFYRSSPFGLRAFCGTCGSVTPIVDQELGLALCPAGNLDGRFDVKPNAHVFVGSKAAWHTITDQLPQHAEF